MAGWHHWLDGRESEWTPGVGDGQGGLAFCDSWGRKESARLSNWTDWLTDWEQSRRCGIMQFLSWGHIDTKCKVGPTTLDKYSPRVPAQTPEPKSFIQQLGWDQMSGTPLLVPTLLFKQVTPSSPAAPAILAKIIMSLITRSLASNPLHFTLPSYC